MKLNSTMRKLPLIALLSLGLTSLPLVASAGHGDHGQPHYKPEHQRDYRGNGHRSNNGYRHGYRDGYSNGYGDSYRQNGHNARYYEHGQRRERVGFMIGLYSH